MIEIQIHPSDIRRRVRYFFLTRRMVLLVLGVSIVMLGLVMLSMAAAPSVIRRAYKTNHLLEVRAEQQVQAKRLKEHVEQMSSLERMLDEQRVRVEKLITIYGLEEEPPGQGGLVSDEGANYGVSPELGDARRKELQLQRSAEKLMEQIEMLALYESANAAMVRHTPSILPVPPDHFVLTSPFGNRISPFTRRTDFHKGLDLAAPTGTPIYATADGVVTFSGRVALGQSVAWWRFGNVVVLRHAERFVTIYAHCDTLAVKAGDVVRQGQVIATVGSTGWSTNSHLHYEIRSDIERPGQFEPVDPRIYILNYQWSNEEALLARRRTPRDYGDFDPLPTAFMGKRRM
jgi:murein DD-endopeptidase MepM/ murein hydrolase activator NlpD